MAGIFFRPEYMWSRKKILNILAASLVILSVSAWYCASETPKGRLLFKRAKVYPQSIQYYNTVQKHRYMAEKGLQSEIVMLGNSITYEGAWSELMQGLEIANRGIPGDRVEGMIRRLPSVVALKPRTVVIMAGINNILQNETAYDVAQKYIILIDSCRTFAETIVCSTLLTAGYTSANDEVVELNTIISQYCNEQHICWIELNALLAPDGILRDEFTYDGLHLTAEAYDVWTRELAPHLLKK